MAASTEDINCSPKREVPTKGVARRGDLKSPQSQKADQAMLSGNGHGHIGKILLRHL